MNASEVARAAGLHRGTAYNILRTLQAEGTRQSESGVVASYLKGRSLVGVTEILADRRRFDRVVQS